MLMIKIAHSYLHVNNYLILQSSATVFIKETARGWSKNGELGVPSISIMVSTYS